VDQLSSFSAEVTRVACEVVNSIQVQILAFKVKLETC